MSKIPEAGATTRVDKREIDWVQIQNHYRVGLLSLREIAASQGISHTAIQKRAKAEKWERDLKSKVKTKADALVTKHEVSNTVASETRVSENLIVETNAKVIADIRIAHRPYIAKIKSLTMTMMVQLEAETGSPELFEKLGELVIDNADADATEMQNKRLDALNKALSLTTRIDNMKKLADTLKVLIGLEREAYGISEVKAVEQQPIQNTAVQVNIDMTAYKERLKRTLGIDLMRKLD